MRVTLRIGFVALAGLTLMSCAPPVAGPGGGASQGSAQAGKKRIVAAALGDVFTVSSYLATGGTGTNQPGFPARWRKISAVSEFNLPSLQNPLPRWVDTMQTPLSRSS